MRRTRGVRRSRPVCLHAGLPNPTLPVPPVTWPPLARSSRLARPLPLAGSLLVAVSTVILGLSMLAPRAALAQDRIIATPLPTQPDTGAVERTPAPPPALGRAPSYPNTWLPRGTATLQALDKVNARHALLTLRPGKPEQFQTLTITLNACVVRPPEQPADAAAFVTVTDSRSDTPPFSGWLLRASPASSMLQHPIYDLRVVGCGQ